jgi:FAD/FMN-containing dehydrogenase
VLGSVLQPAAIDLLDAPAAARLGQRGPALLVQACGNLAAVERYGRELAATLEFEGAEEEALWRGVREFTPGFLRDHPEGAVVRVSCLLTQIEEVMRALDGPSVARAGTGIVYGYFAGARAAAEWARDCGWKAVVEFAPPGQKAGLDLWPHPGDDLEIMKRVKQLFDPGGLLNRGRLYGRI